MIVWRVQNDYRNKTLALDEESSVSELAKLTGSSQSSTWQPFKVFFFREEGRRTVDFPGLSAELVATEKAANLIRELVEDYAEFLPLETEHNRYFIINVTAVIPCLDHNQSQFDYFKSGNIKRIRKAVFDSPCIGNCPIFKIPERLRGTVFVTDAFKQLVEVNGLTGLIFIKVCES